MDTPEWLLSGSPILLQQTCSVARMKASEPSSLVLIPIPATRLGRILSITLTHSFGKFHLLLFHYSKRDRPRSDVVLHGSSPLAPNTDPSSSLLVPLLPAFLPSRVIGPSVTNRSVPRPLSLSPSLQAPPFPRSSSSWAWVAFCPVSLSLNEEGWPVLS
jgi:hypothetical protein